MSEGSLPTLKVERDPAGGKRWNVLIADGPSAGVSVGQFPLKRDALSFIDRHKHLPWGNLYTTVESALRSEESLVTIPRQALDLSEGLRTRISEDLERHKALVWHVNPAMVAWYDCGSAYMLDILKRGGKLPESLPREVDREKQSLQREVDDLKFAMRRVLDELTQAGSNPSGLTEHSLSIISAIVNNSLK